jgi:PTH1 family peptidyl-tRNA hydrolase
MKLIVWLWNPWEKYKKTRHNVWFSMLTEWNDSFLFWTWKYESKYNADCIFSELNCEKIILCKPQTYMNLSWESVAPLANFYKISLNDILVIHDEIDFVTWRIALKLWWSPAWHNWLKSIIEKLWSRDFWRLRIWIDRPVNKNQVTDWVLWKFTSSEIKILEEKKEGIFSEINSFVWVKNFR